MNENLVEKEDKVLLQSTESIEPILPKDDFCEDNLPYKCTISYSLYGTLHTIRFQSEYCSNEELKQKAIQELLECLKRCGVINLIAVHIEGEDRSINII